jgi:hypothetical protein
MMADQESSSNLTPETYIGKNFDSGRNRRMNLSQFIACARNILAGNSGCLSILRLRILREMLSPV